MTRVPVSPAILEWACERAGQTVDTLTPRFPKLEAWLEQEAQPTLKQLERFAKATRAPIGYFFLQTPPEESVPIPDFRTVRNEGVTRPSPDLLDSIYTCQQRQEWYRDFARTMGEPALGFVGSARVTDDVVSTATTMRETLGLDLDERRQCPTWTDTFRRFIEQADAIGVLVMVNGVVGSNTSRKLDPQEFRGFALSDPLAPLVFINGADTKSAQMFTLAHELAHLWLGETALSDVGPASRPTIEAEAWCNQVAAELLVPLDRIREVHQADNALEYEVRRLARTFKVSTLVILRRIHDAGGLTRQQFWAAYEEELARLMALRAGGSGGDFYRTTVARVGKRFARAVVSTTLEGRASFTDAFHLLGFKKMATFRELGMSVGIDSGGT